MSPTRAVSAYAVAALPWTKTWIRCAERCAYPNSTPENACPWFLVAPSHRPQSDASKRQVGFRIHMSPIEDLLVNAAVTFQR
eukprot:7100835-Alexandrium_andersonii.AAC.1